MQVQDRHIERRAIGTRRTRREPNKSSARVGGGAGALVSTREAFGLLLLAHLGEPAALQEKELPSSPRARLALASALPAATDSASGTAQQGGSKAIRARRRSSLHLDEGLARRDEASQQGQGPASRE